MRLVRNLIWLLILLPAPVWAQTAAQSVEVEPVTCWWRTSAASVRMGEPFDVVLTCSALESDAARAVIDRSRLGTASVQFPPYEVVGGAEGVDHVTTGRRFIQYEYTLRLVNENSFGVDVPIPEMAITYRIESRMADASAVQGREQSYLLPPLGIRIASLVPDSARHIREAAVPTLTAIAAREFRARMFSVVALILVSVAGLTLVVALLRWARQQRAGSIEAKTQLIPHRAVLAGVRQQLRALQQQTRAGWTVDLVRQGLALTRVVAAYVADRPVGQRRADKAPADGELAMAGGWLPRRRILVGGATTAAGLDHVTAGPAVDGLRGALQTLTAARYGRDEGLDDGRLDAALAATVTSAARVAARYTVAAEAVAALRRTVLGWRPRAWAR